MMDGMREMISKDGKSCSQCSLSFATIDALSLILLLSLSLSLGLSCPPPWDHLLATSLSELSGYLYRA
jgi:hypothetical protein